MEKTVLEVAGMKCQACVASVKTALATLPGVAEVEVELAAGQAVVTYDPQRISRSDFTIAIEAAGFDVT